MSDEGARIFIEDETLRRGFTQIPNALLERPDLSPGAKLTYMALLSFAWREDSCFPGQERLAKAIGMSKRSIDRFIKELEDVKLVSHKQRGLNQTNIYTLHRFDMSGIANLAKQELPGLASQELPGSQGKNTQVKKNTGGKNGPYTGPKKNGEISDEQWKDYAKTHTNIPWEVDSGDQSE